MNNFETTIAPISRGGLHAGNIDTIQVNIGLKCNLACRHCHVSSSPKRTEAMSWATLQKIISVARETKATLIDITGGAPEMHPDFKRFVVLAREADLIVQVRSNLTIHLEAGYEDCLAFMAKHQVQIIASLPCYLKENVEKQRGIGVYQESIDVIQMLNTLGYGRTPALGLSLVYNPSGPSLPPAQATLEADYKIYLKETYDIDFDHLFTITNVPLGRFLRDLEKSGDKNRYMETLKDAVNLETVPGLMCRHQIDIGYDGTIYDCDFNLALKLPVGFGVVNNIHDFDHATLVNRRIVTGDHCYACTAGAGSSCSGSLVS